MVFPGRAIIRTLPKPLYSYPPHSTTPPPRHVILQSVWGRLHPCPELHLRWRVHAASPMLPHGLFLILLHSRHPHLLYNGHWQHPLQYSQSSRHVLLHTTLGTSPPLRNHIPGPVLYAHFYCRHSTTHTPFHHHTCYGVCCCPPLYLQQQQAIPLPPNCFSAMKRTECNVSNPTL